MISDIIDPASFCQETGACRPGREFALQFASMCEVWLACKEPSWLCFMKLAPLESNLLLWSEKRDELLSMINGFCRERAMPPVMQVTSRYSYRIFDEAKSVELCDLIRARIPCPFPEVTRPNES